MIYRILLLLCLFSLISCVHHVSAPQELWDSEVVFLSSDNIHDVSNTFIAKQIEESPELYKFFKERGAPKAFTLIGSYFGLTSMYMFYPEEELAFEATARTRQALTKWIIYPENNKLWEQYSIYFEDRDFQDPVFYVWDSELKFLEPAPRKFIADNSKKRERLGLVDFSEVGDDQPVVTYTNEDANRLAEEIAKKN